MTWWLLILLYGGGAEPDFSGAFRTERACLEWFKSTEADLEGVKGVLCIPVRAPSAEAL